MLSHLKVSGRWAFHVGAGQALLRLLEGLFLVAVLAAVNGWQELGLSPALRWVSTAVFLAGVFALSMGWDGWKRPVWRNAGWGWLPTGLMAGGLLLWPVRHLWGAPANGYTGSEQLPIAAHLLFWGGAFLLALGLYRSARQEAAEDA